MRKTTEEGLTYTVFDTKLGWIGMLSSDRGLMQVTLPQASDLDVRNVLGSRVEKAALAPRSFEDLTARLRNYFNGHRTEFPDKLDFSGATPFQRQVWEATRLIHYGETRSYSWVGSQIGRPTSARVVGTALGRNPLPIIIPCHRVVGKDGSLCGFGGGLEMKQYLLNLEA